TGLTIALLVGLWKYVLVYAYGWWRTAVYFVLSLGGTIPPDWAGLGFLSREYQFMLDVNKGKIPFWAHAAIESLLVNGLLLVVAVFWVVRLIRRVNRAHPMVVYGEKLDIAKYTRQQMPLYDHLRVFWNLRMMKRSLTQGILRLAENVKVFCLNKQLLTLPEGAHEPVLDESRATRVFTGQLGNMLPLPSSKADYAEALLSVLSVNEKAILAAVLPRLAACDGELATADFDAAIKVSNALVKQYWQTYFNYDPDRPDPSGKKRQSWEIAPPPPPNVAGCDAVIRRYVPHEMVYSCLTRHAYISTAIYDALGNCRRIGVFPPPELRWLKFVDRRLWYLVDCVGRDTPWWEVAGIHAHYLYEEKALRAEEVPQVACAVEALNVELSKVIFTKKEREKIGRDNSQ
ncbi:MAG: hypothetical protein JNM52_10345, partial [Betaproteobacteria bacterium]|nr:hypothetical protein [Betaproteobacteria bacterium]